MRRVVAALSLFAALLPLTATPVAAHPLGNFTVNRAVTVVVGREAIAIRYVIDMAEIPTFAELGRIDRDLDGDVSPKETDAWAIAACDESRHGLRGRLDGQVLEVSEDAAPELTFPIGAGGLETLRLVCRLTAGPAAAAAGWHELEVADTTADERPGWHEVTIAAGAGIEIAASTVPAVSASAELTSYPAASLESPPDVRSGAATFVRVSEAATVVQAAPPPPGERGSADDPLAGLLGAGVAPAVALIVAMGLGMAHAVSPGHGKTVVAAYLVGSRGTLRQAAGLGLTVAATHTAGVFVLGVAVLAARQWIVPDRLIGWLSLISGAVVVALGIGLLLRARGDRHRRRQDHPHAHGHGNDTHPHPHPARRLRAGELVTLGFAGGLVPSASALIVLLVAITTGRLAFGASLIVAFGLGMALVLAGLAAMTSLVSTRLATLSTMRFGTLASRIGSVIPIVSGFAVLAAGAFVVVRALPGLA